MSNFEDVKTFMKVFKQEVKERPEFPDNEVIALRVALIQEELDELCVAVDENDIVGIADALADILCYLRCSCIVWYRPGCMFCRSAS